MTPASGLAIAMLILRQGPMPAPGLMRDGQPIHPGFIEALTTDLADSHPVVAAVDIEGCQRSNRYSSAPEVDGRVLRFRDPGSGGRGYFQYEYLGVLSSRVHVIRVGLSGGGSGFFQSLVFVRIKDSLALEDGHLRKRQTLERLKGDVVRIRRREFRGAAGLGPEQTIERIVK